MKQQDIVIHLSRGGFVFSVVCTVFIGLLCIFMLAGAMFLLIDGSGSLSPGLFILAISGLMWSLFLYILRDTRGKVGWQIILKQNSLALDLPSGRSLIHRLPAIHTELAYQDIEAVETRLESYRSFGLGNMHRSYALKLTSGKVIILGEDRALGTGLESSFLGETVAKIITRGELTIIDLGIAEGQGGILAVAFTKPPPWDAPNIGIEKQQQLWQRAEFTGRLMGIVGVLVLLLYFFSMW